MDKDENKLMDFEMTIGKDKILITIFREDGVYSSSVELLEKK